jgi:hypothetical protein
MGERRECVMLIWRKTADDIIEKVGRARLALHDAPTV